MRPVRSFDNVVVVRHAALGNAKHVEFNTRQNALAPRLFPRLRVKRVQGPVSYRTGDKTAGR